MRQKCVIRFRDIYAPKVRKSLSQHTRQSAKTLTKVQDVDVANVRKTIKVLDSLEFFQAVWKVYRLSGNFSDCLEIFQTVQNFPDCPETFHTVQNFLDCLEIFRTIWKVSRLSGKFPDCPETFKTVWKANGMKGTKGAKGTKLMNGAKVALGDNPFFI